MYIIGLDLSLTGTGVVILNPDKIKNGNAEPAIALSKLIKSRPQGKGPQIEIKRMMKIVDEILKYVQQYANLHPQDGTFAVIEGIAFSARNTSCLAQLAGLNYLVRGTLLNAGIPFVIVQPSTLKKFVTGKGIGQKDLMMLELFKRWNITSADNNVGDAAGLALAGAALTGDRLTVPKFQREVLELLESQYTKKL